MPITATFDPNDQTLEIAGDANRNLIDVTQDAGTIIINGGVIAIQGGLATTGNTSFISIEGGAGDDTLALADDPFLPAGALFGDAGDDRILGSAGGDQIQGGAGNDLVSGRGGDDFLVWQGGDGNDTIEGGDGAD